MTEFEQKDINIANSIYSGDLNTFKKLEREGGVGRINVTKFLGFKNYKYIYYMDPLALIIMGEAKHPNQFLKYKKMIDFMFQKDGYFRLASNLTFYAYKLGGGEGIKDLRRTLPFSDNMKRYLIFLDEHSDYEHERMVGILNGINSEKAQATPIEKQEIQKAKRLLVRIYRRSNPRRKLSSFNTNVFLMNNSRGRLE